MLGLPVAGAEAGAAAAMSRFLTGITKRIPVLSRFMAQGTVSPAPANTQPPRRGPRHPHISGGRTQQKDHVDPLPEQHVARHGLGGFRRRGLKGDDDVDLAIGQFGGEPRRALVVASFAVWVATGAAAQDKSIVVASTTSTQDSGLFGQFCQPRSQDCLVALLVGVGQPIPPASRVSCLGHPGMAPVP